MGEEAAAGRYEPGPEFQEAKAEGMLEMSQTNSKEFWLIQWINDKDLDVYDFHHKELSLKLHEDGNFGSLKSSYGKSYDLVSFAYQQPNATVFLPSGSEIKAVGKISRRVCLVPHREQKPNFGTLTRSSKKSAEAQLHPKNLLINYALKKGIQVPSYCPIHKVLRRDPRLRRLTRFKSKVVIDGQTFESPGEYSNLKEAEMAAAELALMSLTREARSQDQSAEARSQDQSAGSSRKAPRKKKKSCTKKERISDFIAAPLAEALGVGTVSKEQTHEHKEIQDEKPSDVSGKVTEGPDARGAHSNTANEMPQTTSERPKKKAKIAEQ